MLFDVQKFNPAVCEVLSGAQRKQPQPTTGRRTLHTQTQVTGARTPCFGLTEATHRRKPRSRVCLCTAALATPQGSSSTSQKKLELKLCAAAERTKLRIYATFFPQSFLVQ